MAAGIATRVTGLGEIRQKGDCVPILDILLMRNRRRPHFWATFSTVMYIRLCISFDSLATFWQIFNNSSGHPGCNLIFLSSFCLRHAFETMHFRVNNILVRIQPNSNKNRKLF
jgi:hypothetical protein